MSEGSRPENCAIDDDVGVVANNKDGANIRAIVNADACTTNAKLHKSINQMGQRLR